MCPVIIAFALIGSVLNLNWISEETPQIIRTPLGDRIVLAGAPGSGMPGVPLLPLVPLTVALPEGAVARLGKGQINEIAFSPDGETLAVASSLGVYLYDPFTYDDPSAFTEFWRRLQLQLAIGEAF